MQAIEQSEDPVVSAWRVLARVWGAENQDQDANSIIRAVQNARKISNNGKLFFAGGVSSERSSILNEKQISLHLRRHGFTVVSRRGHSIAEIVGALCSATSVVVSGKLEEVVCSVIPESSALVLLGRISVASSPHASRLVGEAVSRLATIIPLEALSEVLNLPAPGYDSDLRPVRILSDAERAFAPGEMLEVVLPADPGRNESLPIHSLVEAGDSDTLLVLFHGGIEPAELRLPRFEWRRLLRLSEHSKLFISDPTLSISEELRNGWYFGTGADDIRSRIVHLIKNISTLVGAHKIVLIGSSAGGFAAIQAASRIPDAVAIAYSTQRSLHYAHHAPWFFQYVLPGMTYEDSYASFGSRLAIEDLFEPGNEFQGKAIWLQNSGDQIHVDKHYRPLCERLLADPSSPDEDLVPGKLRGVFTYWGEGHRVPPPDLFGRAIDAARNWGEVWPGLNWRAQERPPTDAYELSDMLPVPELDTTGDLIFRAGMVSFSGTTTSDGCVALRIAGKWYQAVKADRFGKWAIQQSFAPGESWKVQFVCFDGSLRIVSEPRTIFIKVVQ